MLRLQPKQMSFHSQLYNKIPKDHILKTIDSVVDFSFINGLLENSYCKTFGRPAKEPELMCKLLFLQHLYNLSDEKIIQEAELNLAYLFFLGVNPEESLPNKSLLSKFRTQRLEESTLDEVITEIIRQCVEKGIIDGSSVSMDATHIEANTIKKTPERIMKHLARKIIRSHEKETATPLETIPECPDYTLIDDPKKAKQMMKDYLLSVIAEAEKNTETVITKEWIKKSREILSDPKFINQKGLRSLIDEDARVGRKSRTQDFYGYKAEFVMTTEEKIITSIRTAHGAYMDGDYAGEMLDDTQKTGIAINEVYADKAYFRKPILSKIETLGAQAFIPVSGIAYRIDESSFSYNKDSDQWQCSQGNTTEKKKYYQKKQGRSGYRYYFGMNQCKTCPQKEQCIKKRARKILVVGLHANEFYCISQMQKTEEFKKKYKKRASIEGKNAELKRFHGLYRARGYGLLSVSTQCKLAAIAVNIKRIAKMLSSFTCVFLKKCSNVLKSDLLYLCLKNTT